MSFPEPFTCDELKPSDPLFKGLKPVHSDLKSFRARYWNKQNDELSEAPYVDLREDIEVLRQMNINLNIPEKLIIRNEYKEVYQLLIARQGKRTGHVVSGHPGIGKSLFLLYIVLRRLNEGQSVLIQTCSQIYWIFHPGGVSAFAAKTLLYIIENTPPSYEQRIWGLFDLNDDLQVAPITDRLVVYHVVVSDLNAPRRMKETRAQMCSMIVFMDLWTEQELRLLATLRQYSEDRFMDLAGRFGPSPRNLLCIMDDPSGNTETSLIQEISSSAYAIAQDPYCISSFRFAMEQNVSPALVFLRLHPRYPDRMIHFTYVPSAFLLQEVANAVQKAQPPIDVHRFLNSKWIRPLAEWFFEGWMHSFLTSTSTNDLRVEVHWKGNGTVSTLHLNAHQLTRGVDELKERRKEDGPFYWRPSSTEFGDFSNIDAVMYDGTTLFLFQSVYQNSRAVNFEDYRLVQDVVHTDFNPSNDTPWRFIFIGSNATNFDEGKNWDVLKSWELSSLPVGVAFIGLPNGDRYWKMTERPVPMTDAIMDMPFS